MANYIIFLAGPLATFALAIVFLGLIEGVLPRINYRVRLYEQLDRLPVDDVLWTWFEQELGDSRHNLASLTSAAAVLGGHDPARLADILSRAGVASLKEGRKRREKLAGATAFRVLITLQSNPRLRRYIKNCLVLLSRQIQPFVEDSFVDAGFKLRDLSGSEAIRQPRMAEAVTMWFLDKFIACVVLTIGGLVLLVPFLIYSASHFINFRALPITRTERLGRYANRFQYTELTFAPPMSHRVGTFSRILSVTGLYNYPAYWSVLIGKMSIVGPYPVSPFWFITTTEPGYLRFLVKPGITGLAQVRSYERGRSDWRAFLNEDVFYVRTRSLALNLRIMQQSAFRVIWPGTSDVKAVENTIEEYRRAVLPSAESHGLRPKLSNF